MSPRTILRLTIAALLAAPAAAALADTPAPDTSNWKCESCPFYAGYDAEATAGAIVPGKANAPFGRYTGIDQDKTYVDLDAHGDWRNAAGEYARYELDDLGLDSRTGRITLGQDGHYSVALSYTGQPNRIYDATVTPYLGGGGSLTLPSGWVAAGTPAGMTALAASLQGVDIGTLRKNFGLEARWLLGGGWSVFGSAKREDKTGTEILGASFLTQAVQLPAPVNYETDTFEAGAAWSDAKRSLRLILSDSHFKDDTEALYFQNPYLPLVPSAMLGAIALPPSNEARGANFTASTVLPFNSNASFAAGYTQLTQDQTLLPPSTLPGAVSPGSFNGDVTLQHYAATLGSRPIPNLNVHGRAAYDERNDDSTPLTIAQVVTDVAPGATVTTQNYDYTRWRFDGGADYRLWRWLTVGIGADRHEVDRTQQVVRQTVDGETFGYLRLTPWSMLAINLKGGAASRDAHGIDLALLPPQENPLIVMFNLAPLYREFVELGATLNPTATISLGLQGSWSDDFYRQSTLGLVSGRQRRVEATFGWTPAQTLSFYADGGYEARQTVQDGEFSAASALWQALINDRYWNAGAGARYTHGRWDATVDYSHATSGGETDVGSIGLLGGFPELGTRYDSLRVGVGCGITPALTVRLRYVYQNYSTDDWALDNVGPATLGNLLSLGAPAAAYNVNLVALSFTYRFGTGAAPHKAE
ncbi:MAG TPA: MtrB/PioB family decaheme-associated outer membrane protein [Steroidobacteraceae bacterium]|nr:MtrB/PioB family decaheme-associated outer membrane protein [Steroidobacteraceae bacterium]